MLKHILIGFILSTSLFAVVSNGTPQTTPTQAPVQLEIKGKQIKVKYNAAKNVYVEEIIPFHSVSSIFIKKGLNTDRFLYGFLAPSVNNPVVPLSIFYIDEESYYKLKSLTEFRDDKPLEKKTPLL